VSSCGEDEESGTCSSSKSYSDTIIFANCDGNTLLTCVPKAAGSNEGTWKSTDCAAQGQVCIMNAATIDACGVPAEGDRCRVKDTRTCDESGNVVRCVWISEQPEAGLSGDIGVWRTEQSCDGACSNGNCE
jgi:hypothetical protein